MSDVDVAVPDYSRSTDLSLAETVDSAVADLAHEAAADISVEWVFDPADYEPVHGWILLDSDPEAVKDSIEAAAAYGVNHIQLSHDLIMNVEDILGEQSKGRVETLNMGIDLAHAHGMRAYVWTHEFSGTDIEICYAPQDPVWEKRADAYRQMFELLPDLDGVILMFGSAPLPPWFTLCVCDWCVDGWGPNPLTSPPPEEKVRLVTQAISDVVVNEQGRELFVRTFVHEPAEIGWHSAGLAGVKGVEFTGMHKGPVQDWQPYNPHHPCIGNIGDHPSILELDVAGEYYGLSELPFASPEYYWYRLSHSWENRGIGAVLRVQRGGHHALETPNEVNMLAVARLVENRETSFASIWEEFVGQRYGPQLNESECAVSLADVLRRTFPIRRKSHYVLGIWAMEKSSDLPGDTNLDQFNDRGRMPKWDADWQELWDRLDKPDQEVVQWVWQEGSEAVVLAEWSLAEFTCPQPLLDQPDSLDLQTRLRHQWYAARAWRAVELFIWCKRAVAAGNDFDLRASWQAWAFKELESVKQGMEAEGMTGVSTASPARIGQFLAAVGSSVPQVVATMPAGLGFPPLRFDQTGPTDVTVHFSASKATDVVVDWGLEIPDYGNSKTVAVSAAGEPVSLELPGLEPDRRYVVRLRANYDGMEYRGGDFWLFTRK